MRCCPSHLVISPCPLFHKGLTNDAILEAASASATRVTGAWICTPPVSSSEGRGTQESSWSEQRTRHTCSGQSKTRLTRFKDGAIQLQTALFSPSYFGVVLKGSTSLDCSRVALWLFRDSHAWLPAFMYSLTTPQAPYQRPSSAISQATSACGLYPTAEYHFTTLPAQSFRTFRTGLDKILLLLLHSDYWYRDQ